MRKRVLTIMVSLLIVASIALGGCSGTGTQTPPDSNSEGTQETGTSQGAAVEEDTQTESATDQSAEMTFETAVECVANMKIGWNVGNSLDSTGSWIDKSNMKNFETAWGNPLITKQLMQVVKENGFQAVRVPVTYLDKMDENGTVDEQWLARVKEVVDYVLDEGLYCIINVHHDTGGGSEAWLRADGEMYENGMSERYAYLWEQIATYFQDYDERLLFESFNEILDKNSNWGGSKKENYEVVNKLNQLFVDTVRKTGGNNAQRNIIVLTYGASSAGSQVNGFQVPEDSAENHLIAEVHIYDPSKFCNGEDATWDEEDEKALDKIFKRLNEKIITAQGVPMIIGEFGSQDKFKTDEYTAERAEYAAYFVKTAKQYGITCFWWDDGGSMKIFERRTSKPWCQPVIDALISASEE